VPVQKVVTINNQGLPQLVQLGKADLSGFSRVALDPIHTGELAALTGVWQGEVVLPRGCILKQISANYPCWIRIYGSSSARSEDSTRIKGTAPTAGRGLYAEIGPSAVYPIIHLSPELPFSNNDDPVSDIGYFSVQNLDSAPRDITINLTLLPLEQ
jgi:hypothetical protein